MIKFGNHKMYLEFYQFILKQSLAVIFYFLSLYPYSNPIDNKKKKSILYEIFIFIILFINIVHDYTVLLNTVYYHCLLILVWIFVEKIIFLFLQNYMTERLSNRNCCISISIYFF